MGEGRRNILGKHQEVRKEKDDIEFKFLENHKKKKDQEKMEKNSIN